MTATLPSTRLAYAALGALLLAAAFMLGPWWAALIALLTPDLPLFGGMERGLNPRAVPFYNATHVIVGPLLIAFISPAAALAWAAHIAVDRAAGYGLRDAQGFQR